MNIELVRHQPARPPRRFPKIVATRVWRARYGSMAQLASRFCRYRDQCGVTLLRRCGGLIGAEGADDVLERRRMFRPFSVCEARCGRRRSFGLRGAGGVWLKNWIERFQGLATLSSEVRERLVSRSFLVRAPAGEVIFGPGKSPDNLLLLLSGTIRVQQSSESGREIVLYRVEAGQSCVLTTACLLAHEDYAAEGVAETPVEAEAIPRDVFDDLLAQSPEFRRFVFTAYSRRITDLFQVIDEVAFGRIDARLAQRLQAMEADDGQVRATHQQLATELGTAREVVSRQLQEFQRRGWIAQSRGVITITDPRGLASLAAHESGAR